jgi:hypothetical protein
MCLGAIGFTLFLTWIQSGMKEIIISGKIVIELDRNGF